MLDDPLFQYYIFKTLMECLLFKLFKIPFNESKHDFLFVNEATHHSFFPNWRVQLHGFEIAHKQIYLLSCWENNRMIN